MKQASFQQGPSGITRADTAIHPIHAKNNSDLDDDDATTLDTSSLDIGVAVTDITGAGLIPVLFGYHEQVPELVKPYNSAINCASHSDLVS